MPTYEYQCSKCGAVTEVFQGITEPARRKLRKTDDPQCNCQAAVTRLIGTGAGVIFKGSGFHQTDYRSESYKKAAEADKKTDKDVSSKDGKGKATKGGDGKKAESSAKMEAAATD
ncbi:MAG: FmdB family zinc ribbon protein [Planctomycetota bacterium]|jgi:putative FmdB family regulatory protein